PHSSDEVFQVGLDVLGELRLEYGLPVEPVLLEELLDLLAGCEPIQPRPIEHDCELLPMRVGELVTEVDGYFHGSASKNARTLSAFSSRTRLAPAASSASRTFAASPAATISVAFLTASSSRSSSETSSPIRS